MITIKRHVPLMIVALVGLTVWTGHAQGQRPSPARQAWEYRIVETPTVEGYTPAANVQQLLNQAGAEGLGTGTGERAPLLFQARPVGCDGFG